MTRSTLLKIPKGENWHSALIAALRGCRVGVFCVTPESLRSQWMLFEAGALAQHGDAPEIFTYLYGVPGGRLSGPLGHFQATRFDREDSRQFIRDLATVVTLPASALRLPTPADRPAVRALSA